MGYAFRGGQEAFEALGRKPPHGRPCNKCGLCCMASLCKLGQVVFDQPEIPGPCPALERVSGTHDYVCGLVANTEQYIRSGAPHRLLGALRRAALLVIGAHDGCDARFNGEPRDRLFSAILDQHYEEPAIVKAVNLAKGLWKWAR